MAGFGSLCYLAGQVVSEADVSQGLQHNSKRPLEEALTSLRKGALLLKHGRHGKPKVHFFRVGGCDTLLRWRSASGSVKQVRLRNVVELVAGQTTEVFRRFPLREGACSFSLRYRDEDGTSRTLDLTAADQQQLELWFTGLRVIAARLAALGTPVGGGPAQLAAASSGGLPACAPGSGGLSPADLLRCVSSRMQHSGGPVCLPASDRMPCDLLAWGSAQRAPPVAHSMRSVLGVTEDCWQHRSAPGLAPGGLQLDAYRAAVGRKHAAVITATGAVYTWGEGRSGKLGLGHDQDQAQPQRVRHCLEGQCVVAVACGDDCTAALTDGGELFMWGRPHVDSRLQLVPLQVRGELRGRKVVQVSCGPFHCAAVSSDGLLFTWGEGFGGKLGHGDQSNRTQPCQVAALAGRQVLEVACGVWHTAAIVCEPEGSPYAHSLASTQQQQQQHSPLKQEGSVPAAEGLAAEASSPAHLAGLPHHHRNNSTSSAFSESSVYHDGVGGVLYTWGGVNESVAFGASEKRDSNKGCLGHGEADLYRGQLLPVRVAGALEGKQVRHVAAGSHLTVAVTTGGRLFQMGATGASAPSAKHCPWEGATLPELVRGQLAGIFIEEVSCGMHHVVAMGRALDRKQGRPGDSALRTAFAWGRGTEGQLGVRGFDDSPAPVLVDGLKGRHVLQVACGGSNTMAVCEHDVRRWEPESKEEAEAASRLLNALASEPRQLRFQPAGEGESAMQGSARSGVDGSRQPGEKANVGIVRRSFSMIASRSSITSGGGSGGGGGGGPPNLARLSSSSAQSVRSVGGASAAGSNRGIGFGGGSGGLAAHQQSFTQTYSFMASAAPPPHHRASMPHQLPPPPKLQRLRSDRTTSSVVSASEFNGSTGAQRIVSIGSPAKSAAHSHSGGNGGGNHNARRSTYAGGGGPGLAMVSSRSFTHSLGAGGALSDFSSRSSWQHRPLSEDGGGGGGAEIEADSSGNLVGGANGRRVSSADLAAALDDVRSGSSSLALAEELAEKNRIIERLQLKLDKMQRHQAAAAAAPPPTRSGGGGGTAAEAAERLRESVRASAGAFRAAQQLGLSAAAAQQAQQAAAGGGGGLSRPATASPGGSSQQLSLQRSSLSPSLLRSSGGFAGGGADDDQRAELAAMEALLAKKEAHLEGQQKQLADWAAELQRRETALAWQAAALAGAGGPRPATGGGGVRWAVPPASPASSGAPAVPDPIPSDSPVLAAGRGAGAAAGGGASPAAAVFAAAMAAAATAVSPAVPLAAVSPAVQQRVFSQDAASPGTSQIAPSSTGSGTLPESPALAADEWTEEFEKGVFLTFTTEGGAKKLRRIRFNRSLFSATSAKEWYEANKHQLSQTTGTPRVAGSAAAAPSTRAAASLGSTTTGGSQPVTPVSLSQPPQQEQQQQAQQQREQQQQQDEYQQQAQQLQEQAGQAAPMAARAKAEVEAQAVAGLLHYRQTSRNLSFDARELATFNERLQQALAQQQGPLPLQQGQQPLGGGGSASLPLPQQQPQRLPSRLSRLPRPAAAAAADASTTPAAAASGVAAPGTGGSAPGSPLPADMLAAAAAACADAGVAAGAAAGSGAGASLPAAAVTPVRQQVQAGEEALRDSGGTSGGGGFASADAGTPAAASPLPPALGGEASREWKSAHSSPFPGDSPFSTSRAAGAATAAAADTTAVSAARSDSGSGGSSPIRASGGGTGGGGGGGGSRTSSPLSKTRSAAISSLTRQLSGAKSDLAAKFTPRVAAEQQAGQAAAAAAVARSQQQEEGGSETARSAGSASQATPSPEAAAKRPSSSPSGGGGGFSGKLSRIRRSLTGGGSTGKQK